jgi:hypothetical protein
MPALTMRSTPAPGGLLHGHRISILCVLNEKSHEEGDDLVPVLMTSCQV